MAVARVGSALDRTFVMIFSGMALGLVLEIEGAWIGPVAVLLLGALMVLSLAAFELPRRRSDARGALVALLLGVGILSPAFLLVGRIFPAETWGGWVFLAAAPSAISVIPYATVLRGDVRLALAGTLVTYAAAFAFLPGIAFAFLGAAVDLLPLVEATAFLLLVPLLLSRPLRRLAIPTRTLERGRNVLFLAVYALVTAAIRDVILGDPAGTAVVLGGAGLAIVLAFGTWTAVGRPRAYPEAVRVTYGLFASFKNQTLASALALAFLGPVAALPAVLAGVFEAVWLLVLARVGHVGPRIRAG